MDIIGDNNNEGEDDAILPWHLDLTAPLAGKLSPLHLPCEVNLSEICKHASIKLSISCPVASSLSQRCQGRQVLSYQSQTLKLEKWN